MSTRKYGLFEKKNKNKIWGKLLLKTIEFRTDFWLEQNKIKIARKSSVRKYHKQLFISKWMAINDIIRYNSLLLCRAHIFISFTYQSVEIFLKRYADTLIHATLQRVIKDTFFCCSLYSILKSFRKRQIYRSDSSQLVSLST